MVAIVLAPALWKEHFLVLTVLRPTKEVLLAGGFLVREGRINGGLLVLAAFPLLVAGVWLFYFLGRAYEREISHADLPGIAGRVMPPQRIKELQKLLERRGWKVVFFGRLAAFPSTLLAAAAGASRMPTRTFLLADVAGGVVSLLEVVVAGYVLGDMYEEAGPWLTAVGLAVLVGILVMAGRWLRR